MQESSRTGRRTKTEVSEFSILQLPSSILFEIFLRLPLKSVTKCKLVCHLWFDIISEPSFIINYSKNPYFTTFLIPKYDRARRLSISLHLVCLIEVSRSGEFFHTFIKPKSADFKIGVIESSIIGSSNGLLCTSLLNRVNRDRLKGQICISNPITGDCIALPECLIPARCNEAKNTIHMFGFSRDTNNLKVLRIPIRYQNQFKNGISVGEIFTVGVDEKWRKFPNPLHCNSDWSGRSGTVFKGTAHWILKVYRARSILTFDIENEIFGQISHPSDIVLNRKTLIVVVNDKLCLINYEVSSEICIWTMHEYGVVDSWSKVVVSHNWIPSSVFPPSLVAVALLLNGDIIFSLGADEYAIVSTPELHTLLESGNFGFRRSLISHILTYSPSSLPIENVIQGEIVKI